MLPAAMEYLAEVLKPIGVVVWGERAMIYLGTPIVYNSFMIVPAEEDFLAAVKKLEDSGFHGMPWSYGTVDPELLGTDPLTLEIHRGEIQKYERFDQHSVRFHFPSSFNIEEKVLLLQSRYVHLSPPSAAQISTAPHLLTQQFFVSGNLYFPNKIVLLESFIRVILVEEAAGKVVNDWSPLLSAWAISYICGMLDVGADALDTCEDEKVGAWYNENIGRDRGGLNKAINKRTGRMEKRGAVPSAE